MSATPSLKPAPLPPPRRDTPVALPAIPKKSNALRIWILLAVLGLGGWAAYRFMTASEARNAAARSSGIRTAKVTSGSIQRVLRLTGSTNARNFRTVAAPMMAGPDAGRNLVLIYVAASGSQVRKGDLVASIDAQGMKDHVDDLDAQIAQMDSNLKTRKAQLALNWETLQQTIRAAQARLDRARLDASASEIRTAVDMELLRLSVEEADAAHKQLVGSMPFRKESDGHDLRMLELAMERQVSHRERHRRDIQAFSIRAPIDGMVVMQTLRRGRETVQVQRGDEVAPAQPFMKIVDVATMQVQASASQV